MRLKFARRWVRAWPIMCGLLTSCASLTAQRQPVLGSDARLRVAEAAEAAGDRELATSMYAAAAAENPTETALQVQCAQALVRDGKYSQARDLLAERLKVTPGQIDLTRELGLVDVMLGQPAEAIAQLNQVLSARPRDVRALVGKAVALDLQQRHGEAQGLYHQALAAVPDDPIIANDLALSIMLDGRAREAQAVLAPYRNAMGVPERLKTNLGIIYAAAGDMTQSRQIVSGSVSDEALQQVVKALPNGGSSH